MSLDSELLEWDSKGIFPQLGENEDHFARRAEQIVSGSNIGRYPEYAQARLRKEAGLNTKIELPNNGDRNAIREVNESISRRFKTDLSWVFICYANMGLGDSIPRGLSFAPMEITLDGQDHYTPPFILINSAVLGKKGTYGHELIHTPLQISGAFDLNYAGWRKYEHRLANEATILKQLKSFISTPIINYQFLRTKSRLRQELGDDAGYVLIRSTYDEALDLYCRYSPKDIICRRAERKELKYMIMKERLKL
ncbi:hypothetical protein H6503_05405 [Candidatus Woesearchaeota archaeon]|nr:hypothetical protein [Candidatus Woesearchaeota archaeon]